MLHLSAELNLAHYGRRFEAIKDMERVWELPFLDLLPTKTNIWTLDDQSKILLINDFVNMVRVSASKDQVSFIKHSLSHLTDILVAFKSCVMFPWTLGQLSPSLSR